MAYNLISELTGLTNEQRLAYIQGLNTDLSGLDDFYVTALPVSAITVTPMLAPRPYTEKTSEYSAPTARGIEKGYAPTYTEVDFDNGVMVSGKTQDLLLPGMLDQTFVAMGRLAIMAIAGAATDAVFNDAFTVNGPDGVPLGSASHPSNVGLQSNLVSSALDHAAAQSAERALFATLGRDGQKLAFEATRLIVPPALMHTAQGIVAPATLLGTSGYGTPNPQAGRFTPSVNRHLTSSTKWFLVDGNMWRPHVNVSRPSNPVWKDDPDTPFGRKLLDELTMQVAYHEWYGAICGGT